MKITPRRCVDIKFPQHYMIKFVSVCGIPLGTPVSSPNKTDRHDITEILLKVALNTITLTLRKKTKIVLETA
jgi:hypothetical protein